VQLGSREQHAAGLTVTQHVAAGSVAPLTRPSPQRTAQVMAAIWNAPPHGVEPLFGPVDPGRTECPPRHRAAGRKGGHAKAVSVVPGVIMVALVAAPADAGDRNFVAH
jgi:hypothetical protein